MDELMRVLEGTLSPDGATRGAAEQRLTELQRTPECSLALAQLCLNASADVSLRQMSLTLRRYIAKHWSPFFEHFEGNAPNHELKAQVRELLFRGLGDPSRKVRLSCAYTTAELAHSDWPDEFPQLMDLLLGALDGGQAEHVDGALRVLTDFVKADLSEDQLLPTAQKMLPQLLTILTSPKRFSAVSRARALAVFRQSVVTLHTVRDQYPEAVATAVSSILPEWLETLCRLLASDPAQEIASEQQWAGLAIRIEAFRTLDAILAGFPKLVSAFVPTLINASLAHLQTLAAPFRAIYLVEDSDVEAPTLADEGSDVSVDVARLLALVVEFVGHLSHRKSTVPHFVQADAPTPTLLTLAELLVHFAQVTADDEEKWAEDMNTFAADDDEYALVFSLRLAAYDATEDLVSTYGRPALKAIWTAVQKRSQEATQMKQSGAADWWKGLEASLGIAGSISEEILEAQSEQPPIFDLSQLFALAIMPYLDASSPPYLQGRAFVLSSLCATALPVELAEQHMRHALYVLGSDNTPVPVKISAVRAVKNFCQKLPDLARPHCVQAVSYVAPLLPRASESVLVLLIETIEAALETGGAGLDVQDAGLVFAALLDVWRTNASDPTVTTAVSDLLATYGASSSLIAQHTLLHVILPRLATIMTSHDPDDLVVAPAVSALDSIMSELKAPLLDGLFAAFGGPLFGLLEVTDDQAVMQDGLGILTNIVRKDCAQLLSWRDASSSGLDHVLRILGRTLDASQSELGGLFVGDLVIHLLRRAGDAILPVLPHLLSALVHRLPTAQTASFLQSLILPFAYLIYTQLDTVLSLLEQTAAEGKSGVEVLITAWCANAETIQGFWNRRISLVALARLLASRRPSLEQLPVKGDLIVNARNRNTIMTRSKAKQNPDQFTTVPFPAKALKILLQELLALHEGTSAAAGNGEAAEEEVSDDGGDDWGEDEDVTSRTDLAYLTSLDPEMMPDAQGDEADLKDDPIYSLDLSHFIVTAIRQAVADDAARMTTLAGAHLTEEERGTLRRVVG